MAELHIVIGLVVKRVELLSQTNPLLREFDPIAVGVRHLEATIKLFALLCDLWSMCPEEYRKRSHFFQPGDYQRLVLESIGELPYSRPNRKIAEQPVARKGPVRLGGSVVALRDTDSS